jgi:hypothetical protein
MIDRNSFVLLVLYTPASWPSGVTVFVRVHEQQDKKGTTTSESSRQISPDTLHVLPVSITERQEYSCYETLAHSTYYFFLRCASNPKLVVGLDYEGTKVKVQCDQNSNNIIINMGAGIYRSTGGARTGTVQ